MKTKTLIACSLTVLIAWSAGAQSSTNESPSVNLPPGLEKRDELPPGLQRRDELPPGLAKRTNDFSQSTNFWSGGNTNQFGANTNEFGTNFMAGSTNQIEGGLTPTSERTNTSSRTYRGQQTSVTNQTSVEIQDRAITQADQRILVTVRRTIQSQIPTLSTAGATLPVHFIIENGVVRLVGVVPTETEKERIETVVQQVPGVTRVVNQLRVNVESNGGVRTTTSGSASTTNQFGMSSTNELSATSERTNTQTRIYSSTNQFNGGTNLPPTSETNGASRRYGLPPGLEKRDELPRGLEKRDELPPGLSGRTNSSSVNP